MRPFCIFSIVFRRGVRLGPALKLWTAFQLWASGSAKGVPDSQALDLLEEHGAAPLAARAAVSRHRTSAACDAAATLDDPRASMFGGGEEFLRPGAMLGLQQAEWFPKKV